MPDWDSVADTYADAVKSAFPLHRLLLVALGLLGSMAVQGMTYKSVVETMMRWPIASIRPGEGGLLESALIGNLAIGLGVAACGWVASRGILRLVYGVASRSVNLKGRMRETAASVQRNEKASLEDIKMLSEFIDSALERPRKRLRTINAGSELAAGVAVSGFVAAFWGNALDAAVGAGGVVAAIACQIVATNVFLSQYVGPALLRSSLFGKPLPTPVDSDS